MAEKIKFNRKTANVWRKGLGILEKEYQPFKIYPCGLCYLAWHLQNRNRKAECQRQLNWAFGHKKYDVNFWYSKPNFDGDTTDSAAFHERVVAIGFLIAMNENPPLQ